MAHVARLMIMALALMVLATGAASAETVFVITGPELKPQRVTVSAMTEQGITYYGEDRTLNTAATTSFLQVRRPGEEPINPLMGRPDMVSIALVDGQRIVGNWVAPKPADEGDADGEAAEVEQLTVRHPMLGPLTVSLDDVSQVAFGETLDHDDSPTQDQITLSNGDVLSGFLLGVVGDAIELQIKGSKKPVSLPRTRVTRVRLANPVSQRRQPGHLVHLADGSRLRCEAFSLASDAVKGDRIELSALRVLGKAKRGSKFNMPVAQLRQIDINSDLGRLVALSEVPMKLVAGGEVFGLPMLPTLTAERLRLQAPVTVQFRLPIGAARVSGAAELSVGVEPGRVPPPGSPGAWANCVLELSVDGKAVVKQRLDAQRSEVTINQPVTGRTLLIQLADDANGPVMDRVDLRDVVVLATWPSR